MKLSVNWLKQYVPEFDNDEVHPIAEKCSISLAEVEKVYDIGKGLSNIVAGEILEIVDHPTVNSLKIVTVDVGSDKLDILCGATNIKVGNIVPVCLVGGYVYNPKSQTDMDVIKISEREIGNVKSKGMLCSERELGLGSDHTGIYLLPDHTLVGTNLTEILYDTIIEIENKSISHRPDCFSHEGIAREIAIQNNYKFKPSIKSQPPIQTTQKPLLVDVKDKVNCKRYSVIIISDITVKDSPFWLKARLLASGMRPINNIVDISNYLMLDLGQPSHAFDYDKIAGNKLILRLSKNGEKVKTLDGETRTLKEGMLVNTDAEKIVGIAGIMGAESTEISQKTKTIILQIENFEMFNIRRTARELGLRTEASTRFEKGLDPNLVSKTMFKAVEMITDLAGGEIASEVIDVYPEPELPKQIDFDINKAKTSIGMDIDQKIIINTLKGLGISIEAKEVTSTNNIISLKIPTWRRDLNIPADFIEEIIRIYGYDKLSFALPVRNLKPNNKNKRFNLEKKIIATLVSTGSNQIITYSFVGSELYKKANIDIHDNLKLQNPLSPDLAYLRDTLIPSLLEKVEFNRTKYKELDFCEVSKTTLSKIDDDTDLHIQPKYITGVMSKPETTENGLYRELKGKLDHLFNTIGVKNVRYENLNGSVPFKKAGIFHNRKSALIFCNDTQIGIIGYIHPLVKEHFNIDSSCVAYELNFDLLAQITTDENKYNPIFSYPSVERDLSFWMDDKVEVKKIEESIRTLQVEILNKYQIKDIYRDDKNKNKKSITIQFTLQSSSHTLTDEEINVVMKKLEETIQKAGATLRQGE